MTAYEEFRNKIEQELRRAQRPLTWGEIRALAKLPQKFPNNQWTHQLERDIGLIRKRDVHGVMHWQL